LYGVTLCQRVIARNAYSISSSEFSSNATCVVAFAVEFVLQSRCTGDDFANAKVAGSEVPHV